MDKTVIVEIKMIVHSYHKYRFTVVLSPSHFETFSPLSHLDSKRVMFAESIDFTSHRVRFTEVQV